MGYTHTIDTAKFKVIEDWKPKRKLITREELQEKIRELSPKNTGILEPLSNDARLKESKKSAFLPHMSLKQLIEFLTSIYEEYGDMPFHVYNPETGCYYDRALSHFNIVSKYHLVECNERHQIMHIHNSKALVIEI